MGRGVLFHGVSRSVLCSELHTNGKEGVCVGGNLQIHAS